MPYMYFNPYYLILVVPAIIFSLIVQGSMTSTYKKYSGISNSRGMTGAQMALQILREGGANDVSVEMTKGRLSDHFDPSKKVIRLSPEVYNGTSVASIGVAAHEAGHALQYSQSYFPMRIRSAIVGITNFGSQMIYPLILLSALFQWWALLDIAVLCFGLIFLFQLITLPVEFNASRRAVSIIDQGGFSDADVSGVKKVLSAAAMTYVAAMITALMNMLSFMLNTRRRRNG